MFLIRYDPTDRSRRTFGFACDACHQPLDDGPGWIGDRPQDTICRRCMGSTVDPDAAARWSRAYYQVWQGVIAAFDAGTLAQDTIALPIIAPLPPPTPDEDERPEGKFEECTIHAVPCPSYATDGHSTRHSRATDYEWCCYYCCEFCKKECKDPVTGQARKS